MTNIYRAYLERVTADVIAESHIRQLYSKVYPIAHGYDTDGHVHRRFKINLDEAQASDIVTTLELRTDGGPKVTEGQCLKGATWLRRYGKRLGLPEHIWTVDPSYFRFSHCLQCGDTRWPRFRPWYVAHYPDGTRLGYYAVPWQSGRTEFEYEILEAA